MPLVRVELRNEYGLGNPELYRGAASREDPKAVLDGIAVSGLVGILRKLGDLAGFAADVFHDLHEQIAATSVRAHRMSSRIKLIESALPSLEASIQSQTSHIHFSYMQGSDWHANVQLEHDHLLCSDLPRFIMDSYEECRDPPHLFLLDKFDSAGAGACLKRYSDPTYFKRVWASTQVVETDKAMKEKKIENRKIRGLQTRNAELQHLISLSRHNTSIQFASMGSDEQSSVAEDVSALDVRLKYNLESRSSSFDSRSRNSCIEPVPSMHSSLGSQESVDDEPIQALSNISNDDSYISLPDSVQGQDIHSPVSSVEGHEAQKSRTTMLFNTIVAEGDQDAESEPGNFEQYGKDVKLQKPVEDDFVIETAFFCGNVLPEQDDWKNEAGKPNKNVLNGETNAPDQLTMFSKQGSGDGEAKALEEENLIGNVNLLHKRESSPEKVNKKTTFQELPECTAALTQEPLLTPSYMFQRVDESSDNVATTSNHDPMPSNTVNGLNLFPIIENHFEEPISETENYVDALNIMDSEIEVESENQKEQEQERSSFCNYHVDSASQVPHDLSISIPNLSNVGIDSLSTRMLFACASSENVNFSESLFGTGLDIEEKLSSSDALSSYQSEKQNMPMQNIGFGEPCKTLVSNSDAILNGDSMVRTSRSLCDSHEIGGSKDEPSIKIWTNACLFGVEPSKPPDFNASFTMNHNSEAIIDTEHLSKQLVLSDLQQDVPLLKSSLILKSNVESSKFCSEKINELNNSMCSHADTSPANFRNCNSDILKQTFDTQDSPAFSLKCNDIFEEPIESLPKCLKSKLADDISESHFTHNVPGNAGSSQSKLPATHPCESSTKPLLQSGLLNGILSDTSKRKSVANAESLLAPSTKLEECMSVQQRILPGKVSAHVQQATEREVEAESSIKLSSSRPFLYPFSPHSPPMENMKISFHPMNGIPKSKLKLEFPGGDLHGGIENLMFPSIQLLSENPVSQQYISSESDDDTFCHSSPYSSENIASPQSLIGSDSESWELEEIPETKLDDSKHDNVSRVFEPSHVLDLPILGSLEENSFGPENLGPSRLSNPMLNPLIEQPPPPPLPPLQWRMIKSSLSFKESSTLASGEVFPKIDKQGVQQSPSQMDEGSCSRSHNAEVKTVNRSKSMIETPKSYKKKEVDAVEAKHSDEFVDMMHQIRKRSLSLRRPTGRAFMPEPPTNAKVFAILEKANSICQAHMRSCEGGEDNWSDG